MNKLTSTDQELIRDYLNGQESSLEDIILRHKDKLYAYIFTMVKCHPTTDDIFQDTFIKVIRTLKRGKYNEEGKFLPWVMRIAHNLVIDHFRKNNRMPKFDNSGDFDIFSVISDTSLNAEKVMVKEQVESDVKNHDIDKTIRRTKIIDSHKKCIIQDYSRIVKNDYYTGFNKSQDVIDIHFVWKYFEVIPFTQLKFIIEQIKQISKYSKHIDHE